MKRHVLAVASFWVACLSMFCLRPIFAEESFTTGFEPGDGYAANAAASSLATSPKWIALQNDAYVKNSWAHSGSQALSVMSTLIYPKLSDTKPAQQATLDIWVRPYDNGTGAPLDDSIVSLRNLDEKLTRYATVTFKEDSDGVGGVLTTGVDDKASQFKWKFGTYYHVRITADYSKQTYDVYSGLDEKLAASDLVAKDIPFETPAKNFGTVLLQGGVYHGRTGIMVDDIRVESTPSTEKESSPLTYQIPMGRVVRPLFGLNTHEYYSPKEVEAIRNLGARIVRFAFGWSEVEDKRGDPLKLQAGAFNYMAARQEAQIDLCCLLAYAHPAYIKPQDIGKNIGLSYVKQSDDLYEGWRKYCAFIAKTFGSKGTGQVKYYEVWNEENTDYLGSPEDYTNRILKVASETVRREDPHAFIIFGGVSRSDIGFIRDCLKLGAGEYIDAIAFHPYCGTTPPEDAFHVTEFGFPPEIKSYAEGIAYMQSEIRKYAGRDIPLWVTEMGYATYNSLPGVETNIMVSDIVQAKYLGRFYLQNLALGVDKILWYRFENLGFYGIVRRDDYRPNPAGNVFRELCTLLPQEQNIRVLPFEAKPSKSAGDLHSYFFQRDPHTVLVALWNAGQAGDKYLPTAVDLELPLPNVTDESATSYDLLRGDENQHKVVVQNNKAIVKQVSIYDSPVVLKIRVSDWCN